MLYGWSTLTKYMQTIAKGEDGQCLLIKLTVKQQHFGMKIRAKGKKNKRKTRHEDKPKTYAGRLATTRAEVPLR